MPPPEKKFVTFFKSEKKIPPQQMTVFSIGPKNGLKMDPILIFRRTSCKDEMVKR